MRNVELDADQCGRCLTLIRRHDETVSQFNDRALEVASRAKDGDFFIWANHLARKYRRSTAVILCEDHFVLWCDADEIADGQRHAWRDVDRGQVVTLERSLRKAHARHRA